MIGFGVGFFVNMAMILYFDYRRGLYKGDWERLKRKYLKS